MNLDYAFNHFRKMKIMLPVPLRERGKTSLSFMINDVKLKVETELTSQDIESEKENKKPTLKDPLQLVDSLLSKTDLKFLKSFVTPKLYYLYNKNEGCYLELSREDLKLLVKNLLEVHTRVRISIKAIESVLNELTFDADTNIAGYPTFSNKHVVFTNGVIDLSTHKFTDFSPEIFSLTKVSFPFDPNAKDCPIFMDFLDALSDNHEDRKRFLLVMVNLIIKSYLRLQVFFYLFGPGASGNKMFIDTICMLLGENSVHTTTLKALQNDPFEVLNLAGKKLNVINYIDDYIQEMSVVKAYTGNDSLRARVMRQNATVEVRASGFIVAVGNQPLNVKDRGNAIFRRMRPFKTETVSSNRKPLLKRISHNNWTGPLAKEASAIFNLALNVDPKDYERVQNPEIHVPSFKDLQIETRKSLNPLIEWIRKEVRVEPGAVTPLGGKGRNKKQEQIMRKRLFLYPAYTDWCAGKGIQPYKVSRFSTAFIETYNDLGIEVKKDRRHYGIVMLGVKIDEKVKKVEYQMGGAGR